jgi:flagellar hook-associated protein 2
MSSIRSGTGLISGINTQQLIDALISLQRAKVKRLEDRVAGFQSTQAGVKTLDANVFSILTSVQKLGSSTTFSTFKISNSDETQLKATATEKAKPGSYQVKSIRTASTFSAQSKGFVNADQQAIGAGTLTISGGGSLNRPTAIDALHAGDGIRRGVIRITDRSGQSADIDLANVYSADDVLNAINENTAISITARVEGGHLVLTDTSGSNLRI